MRDASAGCQTPERFEGDVPENGEDHDGDEEYDSRHPRDPAAGPERPSSGMCDLSGQGGQDEPERRDQQGVRAQGAGDPAIDQQVQRPCRTAAGAVETSQLVEGASGDPALRTRSGQACQNGDEHQQKQRGQRYKPCSERSIPGRRQRSPIDRNNWNTA